MRESPRSYAKRVKLPEPSARMVVSRLTVLVCWLRASILALSCSVVIPALAQTPAEDPKDINTYYELTYPALEALGDQLAINAQSILASIDMEVAAEQYISRLDRGDYAGLLSDYVANLDAEQFESLVDTGFTSAFAFYISEISDSEFADLYREFLGELTSDYLVGGSEIDFPEYVLTRILPLDRDQYRILYDDYARTLWRYFVETASEDELLDLLGDDYEEILATTDYSIDAPIYFDDLDAEIIGVSEAQFVAVYTDYVTEMIGGLINDPSILEPAPNSSPLDMSLDDDANNGESAGEENELPGALGLEAITFTDLTPEASLGLLRLNIATVAREYFIGPFKTHLQLHAQLYTEAASDEQLLSLLQLEGFSELIEARRIAYNETNQNRITAIEALLRDEFLTPVRSKLQLVESIRYPNRRLLDIAINLALEDYNPAKSTGGDVLNSEQFGLLLNAVLNSVQAYNRRGVIQNASSAGEGGSTGLAAAAEASWRFVGCGCEIEGDRVIYGFYPSWALPYPGGASQEIDFRYYDRVAYYGMNLDREGELGTDDYWSPQGAMNEFIIRAHYQMTEVDLAIYVPHWQEWSVEQLNVVPKNIIERIEVPLRQGAFTQFAEDFLVPFYPAESETLGRNYMGDGLTLLFDDLEEDNLEQVKDLSNIVLLVQNLSAQLKLRFGEDAPPINLVLDFHQHNTTAVLQQLKLIIGGSEGDTDEYTSRLLVFLEQDIRKSRQQLTQSIQEVFVNNDSEVLDKLFPVLIPALDADGQFSTLSRELTSMRGMFGGETGGAAIWPIPTKNTGADGLVEAAFNQSMELGGSGFWFDAERIIESIYFKQRLWWIFAFTFIFSISLVVIFFSFYEPVNRFALALSRWLGGITLVLFFAVVVFVDPHLHWWRIAYFLFPFLFLVLFLPWQNAPVPAGGVNLKGNKYVNRGIRRQKSRLTRGLRRSIRKAIWHRNAD